MAKVIKTGDFSGVETKIKQAPVGLYHAKVTGVEQKTSSNDEEMVEIIFQLVKDANGKKLSQTYGNLWYYAPLDPDSSWARRMKEVLVAFGLKPKGDNVAKIEGKEALLRLKDGTDQNGDYRPNVANVLKPGSVDEADEEDEDEGDEDEVDLSEMSRAELKEYIKDEELDVKVTRGMDEDDIVAAIEEAQEEAEAEAEEEPDEEEEDEDEDEEEPYDDMSVADLKAELEERGLSTKGAKKALIARLEEDDDSEDEDEDEDEEEPEAESDEDEDEEGDDDEPYSEEELGEFDADELEEVADQFEVEFPSGRLTAAKKKKLIAAILEAQEEEGDEEDEDEDEDEGDNYDEMSVADLKQELKDRDLEAGGTKKVLIARLRKDDEVPV